MIKVPTRFSSEFIEEYYNIVSDIVFINKIDDCKDQSFEYSEFILYLSQNFYKIICSEFDELLEILVEINHRFPVITECYNPKVFFKDSNLNQISTIVEITTIFLRGDDNFARISSLKDAAINESLVLNESLRSYFFEVYINELIDSRDAQSIKSACKKIIDLLKNGSIDVDLIPEWVGELKDIISYNIIPGEILCTLGDELSLDFCPMCNESQVGHIWDGNRIYRQALDHFLPKSKYPIFSLSIYNLIPCCNTCNSLFKRDKDTLNPLHANPYVKGSDDYAFFDIENLVVPMLYNKESGSRVKFIATDTELDNNIKLFKLVGVYNKRATKNVIINLISLFEDYHNEWHNSMSYEDFLTKIIGYDSSKLPYEMVYGKFKMDLVGFMEKINY